MHYAIFIKPFPKTKVNANYPNLNNASEASARSLWIRTHSRHLECELLLDERLVHLPDRSQTPRSEKDVHKEDEKSSLPKEVNTRDLGIFMETEEKLEAGSPKEEQPQKKPQQQRDDPRSLPIPCSIGEVNFKGAPCDLDSNINSMSLYLVNSLEEAHHEEEDKEEEQDKLFPNYDSQLQNILDEFMKTNRASFDKFEAQCGNHVENAYAMEKQLVEREMDQRDASSVRDKDFYKGAEPQPMKSQEQDLQQKEQPSNKAEEKAEIDKIIDMICVLFATVKLKRIWKQHPLFLKFMVFLPNKRKKTDDILHISYKTP
ncbi:hypothetical protein QL285_093638 [Trifolium repens]|nr:hypothetical protein QL285_093638 [Trifolium repens]